MTAGTLPGCAIAAMTLPPAGRKKLIPFRLWYQGKSYLATQQPIAAICCIDTQVLGVTQLPWLSAPDMNFGAESVLQR